MAGNVLGAISGLVKTFAKDDEESQKKAFQLNKKIGVGQALISTAQAVTGALAEPSLIPGERFIKAGIAAAVGAAQITAIDRAQFGGSSTAADVEVPAVNNGAGSQPIAFTSPTNSIEPPTTKVIVTETDIRSVTRNVDGVYSRAVVVQ